MGSTLVKRSARKVDAMTLPMLRHSLLFLLLACTFACSSGGEELPESLKNPSSAEALDQAIKAQCTQETKNVHNLLKCQGKYRTAYCSYKGGSWESFNDGCTDQCNPQRSGNKTACTDDEPFGCDCGASKCWTGIACEAN